MKKYMLGIMIVLIIVIIAIVNIGNNEDKKMTNEGIIVSAEIHEIDYDGKKYNLNEEELRILNEYYSKEDFLSAEPVGEYMDLHSALKIYDKEGNQLDKFYICSNGTMYNTKFYKVQYVELASLMRELIKYE